MEIRPIISITKPSITPSHFAFGPFAVHKGTNNGVLFLVSHNAPNV